MVDKSHIGVVGDPFVMRVESGKLREFARAVYADHAAAGLGDLTADELGTVAMPTFLTSAHHWRTPAQYPWSMIGWDDTRGLHAEEEYIFPDGPPRAGGELHCVSQIDDVYVKHGRRGGELTFAVMGTRFAGSDGRLVAESRMTAVLTAQAPRIAEAPGDAAAFTDGDSTVHSALVVGPVTRTDFVRYAGASGDFVALHHDEPFARRAGFPSVIGQGMFGAGLLGALAARWRGAAQVRRFRVRFLAQIWPGDILACTVTQTGAPEGTGTGLLLECQRQTREVVCCAWATIAAE